MYLLDVPPSPQRLAHPHLQAVLDVARSVGSTLDLDLLLARIMTTVTRMSGADRSTLYIVDAETGELWSRVAQGTGTLEIRLPRGQGLAGWVATHEQAVLLDDAYADPRFSRAWDDETGYRTRSLLCVPFRNASGAVVGVMQCLNKEGGFTEEDRDLLEAIGGICAVAIENAFLVRSLEARNVELARAEAQLRRANAELRILVELERALGQARDEGTILQQALMRLGALFGATDASALLVGDTPHVVSLTGDQLRVRPISRDWAEALLERIDAPLLSSDGGEGQVISAPIEVGGQKIGALQVVHHADAEGGGVRALELVAGRIGSAIAALREHADRERQERLSLVGQMMSGILHDVRTPISAVAGYAELMAEEEDAEAREYFVRRIRNALQLMEEMTQEVLQFARGERDIMVQGLELADFVASTLEVVRPELDRFGTVLEIEGDATGPVRFDVGKVRRVVANLARNAGQAGAKRLVWRIARPDGNVVFELADDGPGIPADLRGRLFQPFATFGKQGGTGLGLAMARRIVEAHGGTISANSGEAAGTTFRIELPAEPLRRTPLM